MNREEIKKRNDEIYFACKKAFSNKDPKKVREELVKVDFTGSEEIDQFYREEKQ